MEHGYFHILLGPIPASITGPGGRELPTGGPGDVPTTTAEGCADQHGIMHGESCFPEETSCGPGAGEGLLMGRVVCTSVSSMEKMLVEEQDKMLMEDAHCSSVPRLLPTPNPVLTLSSVPALGPGWGLGGRAQALLSLMER